MESMEKKLKRKVKRRIKALGASIVLIIVAVALSIGEDILKPFLPEDSAMPQDSVAENGYQVERVVDGDTFVIDYNGEDTKVRLIGVDTPESVSNDKDSNVKWGDKASAYTKKLLTNETVYLEFDKEKQDRYGRLLAYVYLKDQENDYIMLNQTLVMNGYARAAYYSPNGKYRETFEEMEEKAEKQKKGFWKDGFKAAFPKKQRN